MKFKINYKFAEKISYYSLDESARVQEMIEGLADKLTDEEYHEMCHQLYGLEPKFSKIDGECSYQHDKKYHTVAIALQYNVFWRVLEELDSLKQEKQLEEMEASIPSVKNK